MLEEVPGDAGLVLWQSLRNVLLWAAAAPEARRGLFSRAAAERRAGALRGVALDEDLRDPLATVAELLRSPAALPPARVASAASAVARWAEDGGKLATALAFMQAAALAEPTDAGRAFGAGQLARRRGEQVRAEGWLHRAVVLARQNGDWHTYARAYLALGNLSVQRGNIPHAKRMHQRALRMAGRYRMHALEGQALHDLMVIAVEYHEVDEAVRLAAAALRAYGPGHSSVRYLAHDLACVWGRQGQHERALRVFRAALAHFPAPSERALVLANLAWTAGEAGYAEEFRAAAAEACALAHTAEGGRFAPQVLLNLARGAAGLGEDARTEALAGEAAALARARSEAKILALAECLQEDARRGLAAPAAPAREEECPAHPANELVAELVRTLEAAAPAA